MVPYGVTVTVMHVLLFACMCVCCENVRVTAVLVWGPGEVWLRHVHIWVVHVVMGLQLLGAGDITCTGFVGPL